MVCWFEEYRRLGTRSETLAINSVAFRMVAMLEKLLLLIIARQYVEFLPRAGEKSCHAPRIILEAKNQATQPIPSLPSGFPPEVPRSYAFPASSRTRSR